MRFITLFCLVLAFALAEHVVYSQQIDEENIEDKIVRLEELKTATKILEEEQARRDKVAATVGLLTNEQQRFLKQLDEKMTGGQQLTKAEIIRGRQLLPDPAFDQQAANLGRNVARQLHRLGPSSNASQDEKDRFSAKVGIMTNEQQLVLKHINSKIEAGKILSRHEIIRGQSIYPSPEFRKQAILLGRKKNVASDKAIDKKPPLFYRDWRKKTGGTLVTAAFLRLTDNGFVVLEKEEGEWYAVLFSRLSKKDRDYVDNKKSRTK